MIIVALAKSIYVHLCRKYCKISVVIVGAGPIGLTAAVIASKCEKVRKLMIIESSEYQTVINRKYQVSFGGSSINMLKNLGMELNDLDGCWDNTIFYTHVGVYLEYAFSIIKQTCPSVDVEFHTKVSSNISSSCYEHFVM